MKDLYLTYDAVQLAADETFIRWVRNAAAPDEVAWRAWLDRHPEKNRLVEEAAILVKGMNFHPQLPDVDTDQLWKRIQAGSREPAKVQPLAGRRRFPLQIAGVAAAILLLFYVIFGIDRPHRIETALAEHTEQLLPDRSRVQVNADSRLRYDDTGRRINLAGEAFFAVEKGTDFIVETDRGKVQVLGTRFNVYSRGHRFQVQCTEGRVRVTVPTDPEGVILTPGMACILSPAGKLVTETLSGLEAEVGWLQGIYRFNAQPMREVIAEMERQFGITIVATEQIDAQIHTGFFETGELEQALREICWPQNLEFSIQGKQVRITKADTE